MHSQRLTRNLFTVQQTLIAGAYQPSSCFHLEPLYGTEKKVILPSSQTTDDRKKKHSIRKLEASITTMMLKSTQISNPTKREQLQQKIVLKQEALTEKVEKFLSKNDSGVTFRKVINELSLSGFSQPNILVKKALDSTEYTNAKKEEKKLTKQMKELLTCAQAVDTYGGSYGPGLQASVLTMRASLCSLQKSYALSLHHATHSQNAITRQEQIITEEETPPPSRIPTPPLNRRAIVPSPLPCPPHRPLPSLPTITLEDTADDVTPYAIVRRGDPLSATHSPQRQVGPLDPNVIYAQVKKSKSTSSSVVYAELDSALLGGTKKTPPPVKPKPSKVSLPQRTTLKGIQETSF